MARGKKSSGKKSHSKAQSKTDKGQARRPAKQMSAPKQRSCDVDAAPDEKPNASPAAETQQADLSSHPHLHATIQVTPSHEFFSSPLSFPWTPLVLGGLLLVLSLLPWADKAFLWNVMGHAPLLRPHLDSPGIITAMLLLVPLSGLAAVGAWIPSLRSRSWPAVLAGSASLAGLSLLCWYNPSLRMQPFGAWNAAPWGGSVLAASALVSGALWAFIMDHDNLLARSVGLTSAAIVVLSAVMPVYHLGERHIPFVSALVALGEGKVGTGIAALTIWIAAGVSAVALTVMQKTMVRWLWAVAIVLLATSPLFAVLSGTHGPMGIMLLALTEGAWMLLVAWCAANLLMKPPSTWTLSMESLSRWSMGREKDDKTAAQGESLSDDATSASTAWWQESLPFWIGAAALLAGFVALELQAMGYTATDENIYYYQAMLLAHGKLPYRDFFFAHPPVHLLIPAFLFRLFGFHILLAKMISMGAALVSGIMVLLIGKKLIGRIGALVALALYAYSFAVLNAAVNMTGINLTVMFVMTSVYALVSGRPLVSGLLMGTALSTGFYSAAAAAALIILTFTRSNRFGVAYAIGLLGVWGTFNLVFYGLAGSAFLNGVYRYHGKKRPMDPRHMTYLEGPIHMIKALFYNVYVLMSGKSLKKTSFYHGHMIWTTLLALPIWLAVKIRLLPRTGLVGPAPERPWADFLKRWFRLDHQTNRKNGWTRFQNLAGALFWNDADGTIAILWLVTAALVVEFSMFHRLYSFYFVLWYPLMAILTAYSLIRLLSAWLAVPSPSALHKDEPKASKGSKTGKTQRSHRASAKSGVGAVIGGYRSRLLWSTAVLTFLVSLYPSCENWAQHVHKSEFRRKGQVLHYAWHKPMVADALSPAVKALFWEDHRVRAESVPGFRQFLWNKKRHFVSAPTIAAYIHDHTTPDETIVGASAIAPLLALLAHRHIAAEIVDTNTNRFLAGLLTETGFYEKVCHTKLAYIVSAPRSFFSWRKMRYHRRFLDSFQLEKQFLDPQILYGRPFPILLLHRTSTGGPPYCRFKGGFRMPRRRRRRP